MQQPRLEWTYRSGSGDFLEHFLNLIHVVLPINFFNLVTNVQLVQCLFGHFAEIAGGF